MYNKSQIKQLTYSMCLSQSKIRYAEFKKALDIKPIFQACMASAKVKLLSKIQA